MNQPVLADVDKFTAKTLVMIYDDIMWKKNRKSLQIWSNLHDSLTVGPYCPNEGVFCTPAFTTPPPQKKMVPPPPPREKTMHDLQGETPKPTRSSLQTQQANSLESSEIFNPWHPWLAWASATWFLWSDGRLEGKLQQKESPGFFFKKKMFFRICFCLFGKSFWQGDIYLFESTSCS